GPAGHEQVNDALGPRFEVRLRPGGGSLQASLVEEGGEAHRADTEGAVAEEMTAGPEQEGIDHASSLKGNASGGMRRLYRSAVWRLHPLREKSGEPERKPLSSTS